MPSGTGQSISVVTDALRTYSAISDGMAAEVVAASGSQALASQVELVGAFGPIGKGFLAAFHQAEAAHLDNAGRVAVAHAAMSQKSAGAAAEYDATDAASGAASESIAREI